MQQLWTVLAFGRQARDADRERDDPAVLLDDASALRTPSDLDWIAVVRSSTILQLDADVPFGHAGAVSGVLVCPIVTTAAEAAAGASSAAASEAEPAQQSAGSSESV